MKNKIPGLYIHIPFCQDICSYCAFSKMFYISDFAKRYLNSLKEELKSYINYEFDSIYIGGGTPTVLSLDELEYLFKIISPFLDSCHSITIETNPSLSIDKINILKKYKVNRVSVGVQTFNKKYLELINRHSDVDEVRQLITNLNMIGIHDINIDLIYGFNDQTIQELDSDLDLFLSLDVKHISTYCLQIEKGTILFNKNYKEANQDLASDLYNHIVDRLKVNGFNRYEVSNFAKKSYESKHNLIYWNNQEYVGVGLGAASYIGNIRRSNTLSLNKYLNMNFQDYSEVVNSEDKEFYFIMLGLRKSQGISLNEYKQIFKKDFLLEYKDKISELIKVDDLQIVNNYIKVKDDKLFILDYILRKLLF